LFRLFFNVGIVCPGEAGAASDISSVSASGASS
jgi:hypothetical protein